MSQSSNISAGMQQGSSTLMQQNYWATQPVQPQRSAQQSANFGSGGNPPGDLRQHQQPFTGANSQMAAPFSAAHSQGAFIAPQQQHLYAQPDTQARLVPVSGSTSTGSAPSAHPQQGLVQTQPGHLQGQAQLPGQPTFPDLQQGQHAVTTAHVQQGSQANFGAEPRQLSTMEQLLGDTDIENFESFLFS